MARPQVSFCAPIDEELTELEKTCDVKTYIAEQTKYNFFIQRRRNKVNLKTLALIVQGQGTLLRWPQLYYTSSLLFQDINFNQNTTNKYLLDFYQIMRLNIFEHRNSTQIGGVNQGSSRYKFPLAQAQGIKISMISVIPDNSYLLVENIFEDINDLINKFFWFITVLDINELLRYLKYISNKDERSRYNLGAAFAPSHTDSHLREPSITRLGDQINELKRKLEEDAEEHEKKNKSNPTPISPSKDNNRQLPTTIINTSTTTINLLTTTINTPTTTINLPTIINTSTTTINTPIINFISCPICKNEFKENEIELHLKEYIKNPLSKDTVHNKLKMKKQSIAFDKMKELVSKLTDIQVKELIDRI
ncbi:21237_t:CDS:2 [Racocetra persica]|uniref:21237_t:CDS:1 n=1 Tax=Racocetra persica TaxID=160502 RepID=A0ACA9REQ3_9GLOM|nr:21237_t:CDS:2 [Racocetra persica]